MPRWKTSAIAGGTLLVLAGIQIMLPYLNTQAFAFTKRRQATEIALNLNVSTDPQTLYTLERVIALFPPEHVSVIKNINIYRNQELPRGRSNGKTVEFNLTQIDSQDELAAVAIHEFCHSVDFEYLVGKSNTRSNFLDAGNYLPIDDPSVRFYELSWEKNNQILPVRSSADFLSLYSMTNINEDFAESCLSYMLHAEDFLVEAQKNDVLYQKYLFMKKIAFNDWFYESVTDEFIPQAYDRTLTSYSFKTFYERNRNAYPEAGAIAQTPQLRVARQFNNAI